MGQFTYSQILPYSPEKVFDVFRDQFIKTFSGFNPINAKGATVERNVKGISGYTFHLSLEITDFQENRVYELTTHASNQQDYVSRYELELLAEGNTLLTFTESNTTPGIFGRMNAIIASLLFKPRAVKKAKRVFESITNEIEKKSAYKV